MALTIDNLQIEIEANSKKASSGLDDLQKSLKSLKDAVGGSSGMVSELKGIADAMRSLSEIGRVRVSPNFKQLEKIKDLATAFDGIDVSSISLNMLDLSEGLNALSAVGKVRLSTNFKQFEKIKDLAASFEGVDVATMSTNMQELAKGLSALSGVSKLNVNMGSTAQGIKDLVSAVGGLGLVDLIKFNAQMKGVASGLSQLSGVGSIRIGSTISQLAKLPEVTKTLDPATIEEFGKAIKRLTEVLDPLVAQMDTVYKGFSALPASVQRSVNAINQTESANKRAALSFKELTQELYYAVRKFMTFMYAAERVARVFANWFNESNDYVENLNLFNVAMGDASDEALEFAQKMEDLMGIDMSEWIENQGAFMRMATGFGIASDKAETMSRNLTQLAYDMSSIFNVDVEVAMQKLQSGMSGQIKGLKTWGYNLSVAALQETALSLGIEQSVRTMSEAQKAQLRYITLIQKSQGVMGDMAKTINTPANAMRILQAQITRLNRALGNIVSVLITKYIPYIRAFVEIVEEMATALAEAWGFEIPEMPETNLEMGADIIEGIGDESEDTEDSLKELKKQLMGFDELNILDSGNDDTSYDFDLDLPDYDFMYGLEAIDLEPYKEQLKNIFKLATDIGIVLASLYIGKSVFSGLNTLNTLLGTTLATASAIKLSLGVGLSVAGFSLEIKGIIDTIKEQLDGKNLAEIIGGSLMGTGGVAVVGSAIADWVATVFASSAVDLAITQAGINLGVGTVGAAGAALGAAVAGIIAGIPAYIVGIYDAITKELTWLNSALTAFGATLAGVGIGTIIGACGGPIGAGVGALIGLVVGITTDGVLAIIDIIKNGANTVNTIVALVSASVMASTVPVIGPIISIASSIGIAIALISEFSDEISALWQKFAETPFGSWIAKNLVQPLSGVFSWVSELLESFGQTASDIFYNVGVIANGCWQILKQGASLAWQGIKETFAPLAEFFGNIFSKAWEKVVAVFSPLGPIFEKIKEGILSAFKTVVNGLINGLNKVIAIPFKGINDALSMLQKADILGLKPFAGLKTISIPEIPLLASGGFPDAGSLFIANEAGPELVGRIGNKTAVANNDQIVAGIASAVYEAMMAAQADGRGGNGGTARIVVQIGERAVGEASVEYINGQIRQTGTNPINY